MNVSGLRAAFESHCPPKGTEAERAKGVDTFVAEFAEGLGITYNDIGVPSYDPSKARYAPENFTLKGLAVAICGAEWHYALEQSCGRRTELSRRFSAETAGAAMAMTPGNMPNVSSYLGSIGGLLDAKIMARYSAPEFINDKLCRTEPIKVRQRKNIGTGRIGDMAKRRQPGDPHSFVQFEERYSWTTPVENDGLACAVTMENIAYDETKEVLDKAGSVGMELGYGREMQFFQVFAGVTNPYNYRGSSYNTYLTSGNWINDSSNAFVDWTSLNVALALGSRMTDQEKGLRVVVDYDTIVCSPKRKAYIEAYLASAQVQQRTQTSAFVAQGPNPMARAGISQVLSSPNLDDLLTRSASATPRAGLALSQSNADEYWWLVKTGPNGAFYRNEGFPITVEQATPDSFTMKNHRLVLAVFADKNESFDVEDPRLVIRNKN